MMVKVKDSYVVAEPDVTKPGLMLTFRNLFFVTQSVPSTSDKYNFSKFD